MQKIYPILLLIGAALCFYAGFLVGQKKPKYVVTEPSKVKEVAPNAEPTTADTSEAPEPEPEPVETADAPAIEAAPDTPETDPLQERAQSPIQTFNDTTGRTLVAEVIEPGADSLKVRRQADRKILTIPISMLADEDRAFAAYLWKQHQKNQSAALSDEEMLERIFGEFD